MALKKLKAKLYLNGILVTELVIPDGVTRIKDYAFSNCSFLTSVTIPDGVTSIGDCAFEYCSSLTSVVIPDSVTSMGDCVFKRCSSLTSVIISNNVATIGIRAFGDCSSLTSIVIPNGVTSIGEYAFNTCESLTNITIPNSVTSMGNRVFYDCAALTDVYYTGSAAQWAKISMDEDDVALLASVNIHYGDASDEDITEPEYAEGDVVIRTAEDLMAFNQSVNDYYFGYYEFITVHLAADIDLSGYEWIPLYGDNLSEVTFDGHGYTISNMYIPYNLDGNLTNRGDLMLGAGFVGVVTQNLYFKNLNFDHCSVEAYERHVGCVVGRNLSGLVMMENVNVTNFTGDGWYDFDNRGNRGTAFRVAGLMGANQSQASFENCHVENVKLTGYHSLAGLVGFDQSGSLDESCFVDCSVENLECYFGYGMKYNVSQAQKYVAAFCNFDGFVDKTDACVASGNTYENVRYFDIADNNREYTPDNFRSTNG